MDNFLTAQQVEQLLKVNRITIYRMLQDGRLKGVKIGQQWRFPEYQFEKLMTGSHLKSEVAVESVSKSALPVHCLQTIQDLFASMGKIPTLIIDPQGEPITELSQPSLYIGLLLQTPNGKDLCQEAWKQASNANLMDEWFVCSLGFACYRLSIKNEGEDIAYILLGQFLTSEAVNNAILFDGIAERCRVPSTTLKEKYRDLGILDDQLRIQVEVWGSELVHAIESILIERANLLGRLHRIVEIGSV